MFLPIICTTPHNDNLLFTIKTTDNWNNKRMFYLQKGELINANVGCWPLFSYTNNYKATNGINGHNVADISRKNADTINLTDDTSEAISEIVLIQKGKKKKKQFVFVTEFHR